MGDELMDDHYIWISGMLLNLQVKQINFLQKGMIMIVTISKNICWLTFRGATLKYGEPSDLSLHLRLLSISTP